MSGGRRSPSLRARVAVAAALGTTVVVLLLAALASVVLGRSEYAQLDRRLAAVADVVVPGAVEGTGVGGRRSYAVTVRTDGAVSTGTAVLLPATGPGYSTVDVGGRPYRVLAVAVGRDVVVSVGTPTAGTRAAVARVRREVLAVGAVAVALAGALGWGLGGRAVRPLRRLAEGAAAVGTGADVVSGDGALEAEQLAAEINGMLARLRHAQERTDAALRTARDFAAAAQHELRTPLTALRTDLEVLGLGALAEGERAQVLRDLTRTQARLEETVTALGRLAAGELADESGHVPLEVTELLHELAHDAGRSATGVQVSVRPGPVAVVRAWPPGVRMAVQNLVTNAVRHGGARRVELGVQVVPGGLLVTVDDDGCGVPKAERTAVFDRFTRGSTATASGSGLGLAIVAQQAELHGGHAWLELSPLGGTRAVLALGSGPDVSWR